MGSVLLHLGPLHPVEGLVMTGLALLPFVVVAVVLIVVSRRDRREDRRGAVSPDTAPREAASQDIRSRDA